MSSHNLSEVQSICSRVIMIKDAHIIFDGSVNEIMKTSNKEIKTINPPKIIIDRIINAIGAEAIHEENGEVTIKVKRLASVLKILMDYEHEDFYIEKPSLESRFINLY